MSEYDHITFEEREHIALFHAEGMGLRRIGREIGRSTSTISRELKRNSNKDGSYRPASAEGRYLFRRQRERILDQDKASALFVRERLYEGWSPESISGWLRNGNEELPYVSPETIYDWVFSLKEEKLYRYLPSKKSSKRGRRKRRKTRSMIAGRVSIHDRPEAVNNREEVGHWEGDLMICNRTRPVLVLKERKSRYVIAAKLNGKTAAETAQAIINIFKRLSPDIRKSITFDNGGEFAKHKLVKDAFKMATWFCDAYASWQKGAVENANGRLRRDLPRKMDIDKVSEEEFQDIILSHNLTPRKCLNFITPAQALLKELGTDVTLSFRSTVALRS